MHYSRWLCAALLVGSVPAFAAPDSCERVKTDIQQKKLLTMASRSPGSN